MMKDLKYFAAYIAPVLAFIGLYFGSIYTYSAVLFAFVFIPVIEYFLSKSTYNLNQEERNSKLKNRFFDYLLYSNVVLIYAILIYFIYWLRFEHSTLEYVGAVLSVGTLLGANGINVAHELGHRRTNFERILSKLLLLPSFYMHFIIEHNLGHHKHVSTPKDPASARYNEWIYVFWFRSTIYSYLSAWKLEKEVIQRKKGQFWSIKNRMIQFTLFQSIYVATLFLLLPIKMVLLVIITGIFGFLLLETINYIEHYGLVRKQLPSGRYEKVQPKHSWNSNHEFGRIVLYELTRHSDHHYQATKKYQILDHFEESPQLPYGYPTSMLLSLIPPLWFFIMNKRVKNLT